MRVSLGVAYQLAKLHQVAPMFEAAGDTDIPSYHAYMVGRLLSC